MSLISSRAGRLKNVATCSSCGVEFAVRSCPKCGASVAIARRKANQALVKYSYAILAGLLGILIADHYFPLLDRNAVLVIGLCVFFAPVIFHIVSSVRKRLGLDLGRLQKAYLAAGGISTFLALLVACNGAFDRSAATELRTSVIRKQAMRGRSGPSYTLKVRSWRGGRATEDLAVNARVYRDASVEKPVVVEMHGGAFGLPWYGAISTE
jgi:predicted RNA-binding Zn-ribbon protein involved in translation (DUF1610 family)